MIWWSSLPALSALSCLGLALFVLSRKPRHPVHQSFALGMVALAVMEFGHLMAIASGSPGSYPWWERFALAGEILLPGPWLVFSLLFWRADPQAALRRWRIGILLVAAATAGFLAALGLGVFVAPDLALQPAGYWFAILQLLALTAVLANLERTVRSANHEQRWRMKYFVVGIMCIMVGHLYVLSQVLLFSSIDPWVSPLLSTVIIIGCGLMAYSLARHRLLDVDVFLSRYVVYQSVTVVAVGAYLLAVGLAVQAVKSLGGDVNAYLGSLLAVLCLLALGLVLLSHDARQRLRIFIDRHFFKYKYDYRKEWLELTERLSSKPTVEELASALTTMIFETFWIKHVVLWLVDDREHELWPVYGAPPGSHAMRWRPTTLDALASRDYPMVVDAPSDRPQETVLDPSERAALAALNVRLLVPLMVQRRLIGVLGLSQSQAGFTLTHEDYDLMRTMGKQAAGSFVTAQLSQQLVASKELETFHALSTFLLHDLKNFVSMLSLLVDNMERNFENPAFRHDALQSLSQTVDKMKRLMEGLHALAHSPEPSFESVDLNQLARAVLVHLTPSLTAKLVKEFHEVPPVRADPTLLKQVFTNLLLNAEDAIDAGGEIRVSTRSVDGMVACAVADNGRGIAPEFLATRLFKPFATTKSHGFGIGLYQSKTIIEAHGGRLQAESQVGRGSTLTFTLPVLTRTDGR